MRRTRRMPVVGAAVCGLVLAGCAGSGDASGGASPGASPGSAWPTTASAASAVSGPWRAWTTTLSAQEAAGSCTATAHQVVCAAGSGGLVGRSRATGEVTWTVPSVSGGRRAALAVDAGTERAVTGAGRVLRAADLRRGTAAWTRQLSADRAYFDVRAADGIVYALDALSRTHQDVSLSAFRAADGRPLWHRAVEADPTAGITAFGGRVYSTDGTRVTARDTRTGATEATSPRGTECPHLVSGAAYLVCTGSPLSAEDSFPPLRRLDPVTLKPLPTPEDTGMQPERGLISADGVLVLLEDSAEDPGGGAWNAYDLVHGRKMWSYATSTKEAGLVGGRFVTFTPLDDATARGRLITIDLHAGPQGTGTAAPRMSAAYPQTRYEENPVLVVPGGEAGHVVVMARTHPGLRSLPLP